MSTTMRAMEETFMGNLPEQEGLRPFPGDRRGSSCQGPPRNARGHGRFQPASASSCTVYVLCLKLELMTRPNTPLLRLLACALLLEVFGSGKNFAWGDDA